jgi:hypothetical protein
MKTVISVNLEHKKYGLERARIKNHDCMTAVIGNLRKYLHNLGYDLSLLNDSEILAFEDLVYEAEQDNDNSYLITVLDFNS